MGRSKPGLHVERDALRRDLGVRGAKKHVVDVLSVLGAVEVERRVGGGVVLVAPLREQAARLDDLDVGQLELDYWTCVKAAAKRSNYNASLSAEDSRPVQSNVDDCPRLQELLDCHRGGGLQRPNGSGITLLRDLIVRPEHHRIIGRNDGAIHIITRCLGCRRNPIRSSRSRNRWWRCVANSSIWNTLLLRPITSSRWWGSNRTLH